MMSSCRMSIILFVCLGLTALSVYGGVPSNNVVDSESLSSRFRHSSWIYANGLLPPKRTTKQIYRPRIVITTQLPPINNPNIVQTSNGVNDESQYNECSISCRDRTTKEYNPVCGSDSRTYGNRQILNCFANCGISTELSYIGACAKRNTNTITTTTTQLPPINNPNTAQTSNGVNDESQFNECSISCRDRTTKEYNPVCGSDSRTYGNRQILNCFANCGISTELSYVGTCVRGS